MSSASGASGPAPAATKNWEFSVDGKGVGHLVLNGKRIRVKATDDEGKEIPLSECKKEIEVLVQEFLAKIPTPAAKRLDPSSSAAAEPPPLQEDLLYDVLSQGVVTDQTGVFKEVGGKVSELTRVDSKVLYDTMAKVNQVANRLFEEMEPTHRYLDPEGGKSHFIPSSAGSPPMRLRFSREADSSGPITPPEKEQPPPSGGFWNLGTRIYTWFVGKAPESFTADLMADGYSLRIQQSPNGSSEEGHYHTKKSIEATFKKFKPSESLKKALTEDGIITVTSNGVNSIGCTLVWSDSDFFQSLTSKMPVKASLTISAGPTKKEE